MKIRHLLLMIFALGCLSSTAHAGFFSILKKKIEDYKENNGGEWPTRTYNNYNTEDKPDYSEIWEKICGGEDREWNFQETQDCWDFQSCIDKFKEICGDRIEVTDWCDVIKEKCDWEPRYRCPQPPGSAIPEPSTYGMIGAGALIGLIAFRRFKTKK